MSRSPIAGGAALSIAPQIQQAEPNDVPRMATSLARAFVDDPVANWMLPQARRYTRKIAMFTLMLRSHVSFAETYCTPDGVGAAVWAPPGRWRLDIDAMAASVQEYASIFGPDLARAIEVHTTLEGNHPTDPPHWYLAALGTHPDWQGNGIGTALMQPILARSDAEGLPAYLESSKERNIAYYRRVGFEVTGEIHVPNGGPILWSMWREPQLP